MIILLSSHAFSPSVGGIEKVSSLLAQTWTNCGHHVEILTQTEGPATWKGLTVHRRPEFGTVRRLAKSADFYFQSNLSLRTLLPAADQIAKTVILHQTYLHPWGKPPQVVGYLKWIFASAFKNLAISHAVASRLPKCCAVVGNLYDDSVFRPLAGIPRDRDLVFVGRLVSDKGVDMLLNALQIIVKKGNQMRPRLTIVGDGPEKQTLQKLARDLDLDSLVEFVGKVSGEELAGLLHRYRILVVPSVWPEPFGLVALEGAACGCIVIGSNGGGLPDAIGPCGLTFRSGSAESLALAIEQAFAGPGVSVDIARRHLEGFTTAIFAEKLLAHARMATLTN
jgi:glycosyltransferase involved in cell wall biosynthesis